MKNILLSWIGHADLKALHSYTTPTIKNKIESIVGNVSPNNKSAANGPIKTLLNSYSFDHIYLINNYPQQVSNALCKWLSASVTLIDVSVQNPTDYVELYPITCAAFEQIQKKFKSNYEQSVLLSPGTPSMVSLLVLLGKTKYPSTFYQTYDGKAWETKIPFDLTLDVLPELLSGSSALIEHLTAKSPKELQGFENIIGESSAIRYAVGRARKVAIRDVSVLLAGESGTGKELFAQAIHAASPRRTKPFIAINCAAIPKELLESELFGHKKGSFTGALQDRIGAFQRANGGTLFLDEVGECPFEVQAKLLRVLQPINGEKSSLREITPLGSMAVEKVDVRIISATNRDLLSLSKSSLFRVDLFYRLATISIKLPLLRERRADIILIAEALLQKINSEFSAQEPGYRDKYFSGSTKIFIKQADWPGNVRELQNAIIQAVVMADGEVIEKDMIVSALLEAGQSSNPEESYDDIPEAFDIEEHIDAIRRKFIVIAMAKTRGVKTHAAQLLGLKNYQTLDAQIKRLNIQNEWDT